MTELKIEMLDTNTIMPYWNNARNNRKAIGVVEKSIKKYGFNQPIAIDEKNEIIAGHTRFFAATNLGLEKVPCVRLSLSEELCRQYRIADNKTHEFSFWDDEKLRRELAVLDSAFEMQDFFFEDIGSVIGFQPEAPKTEQQFEDFKILPQSYTEEQIDKFNNRLNETSEKQNYKPTEYIEFRCTNCGELMTISK